MILRVCAVVVIVMLALTNLYLRHEAHQFEIVTNSIEPELIRNSYFIGCSRQSLDFKECHDLADEFVNDYLNAIKD